MAKRRSSLKVRIPPYVVPRLEWRQQLYGILRNEALKHGIRYGPSDCLELKVVLYLRPPHIDFHDVDNRLKDIMDALQGRMGGPKRDRRYEPVVPNDSQFFRVEIEKRIPPPQSHGFGHLVVRKCSVPSR